MNPFNFNFNFKFDDVNLGKLYNDANKSGKANLTSNAGDVANKSNVSGANTYGTSTSKGTETLDLSATTSTSDTSSVDITTKTETNNPLYEKSVDSNPTKSNMNPVENNNPTSTNTMSSTKSNSKTEQTNISPTGTNNSTNNGNMASTDSKSDGSFDMSKNSQTQNTNTTNTMSSKGNQNELNKMNSKYNKNDQSANGSINTSGSSMQKNDDNSMDMFNTNTSNSFDMGDDFGVNINMDNQKDGSNGSVEHKDGKIIFTEVDSVGKTVRTEIDESEYIGSLKAYGLRDLDIKRVLSGSITLENLIEEIQNDSDSTRRGEMLEASYLQAYGLEFSSLRELDDAIDSTKKEITALKDQRETEDSHEVDAVMSVITRMQQGESFDNIISSEIVAWEYKNKNGETCIRYDDPYLGMGPANSEIVYYPKTIEQMYGESSLLRELKSVLTVEKFKPLFSKEEKTVYKWNNTDEQNKFFDKFANQYNSITSQRTNDIKAIDTKLEELQSQVSTYQYIYDYISKEISYYLKYIDAYINNADYQIYNSFDKKQLNNLEKFKNAHQNTSLPDFYDGLPIIEVSSKEEVTTLVACMLNGEEPKDGKYISIGTILYQISSDDDIVENFGSWKSLMTDEEKSIFNYILNKEGVDSAYEYLQNISNELDYRWLADMTMNDQEYAKEHPVLASIASIVVTPIEGLSAACYSLNSHLSNEKLRRTNVYSSGDVWRSEVAQDIAEAHGEGWSFVYSTGMSMADSVSLIGVSVLTGGAAVPALSATLMGSRAYVSTLNDALDRGLSDGSAIALAFSSAAVETLMESYSVGHLLNLETKLGTSTSKLVSKIANSVPNETLANIATKSTYLVASALSQGIAEGEEEFATEILNYVFDEIISGDLSNHTISIDNYISMGKTEEEARNLANAEFVNQLGQAFLGGFASGVCFGAFGGVTTTHRVSKSIAQDIQSQFEGTKAQKFAQGIEISRTQAEMMEEINKISKKQERAETVEKLKKIFIKNNDVETTYFDATTIPLSEDSVLRSAQEKILNGLSISELTTNEKLKLGRDNVVREINGYKLKNDCVYRVINLELFNKYVEEGFVLGLDESDEYDQNSGNGGVDWYLAGAAIGRYGKGGSGKVVIECPADTRYFVPTKDNGSGMAKDPLVRHMKSSGFKNPVPMSMIKVVMHPDASKITVNINGKVDTDISPNIDVQSTEVLQSQTIQEEFRALNENVNEIEFKQSLENTETDFGLETETIPSLIEKIKTMTEADIPEGYTSLFDYKKAFIASLIETGTLDKLSNGIVFTITQDSEMLNMLIGTAKLEELYIKNLVKLSDLICPTFSLLSVESLNKIFSTPSMQDFINTMPTADFINVINNFNNANWLSSETLINRISNLESQELYSLLKKLGYYSPKIEKYLKSNGNLNSYIKLLEIFEKTLQNKEFVMENFKITDSIKFSLLSEYILRDLPNTESIIAKISTIKDTIKTYEREVKQAFKSNSSIPLDDEAIAKVDEQYKYYTLTYELNGKTETRSLSQSGGNIFIYSMPFDNDNYISEMLNGNLKILSLEADVKKSALVLTKEQGFDKGLNDITFLLDGKETHLLVASNYDNADLNTIQYKKHFENVDEIKVKSILNKGSLNITVEDIGSIYEISYYIDGENHRDFIKGKKIPFSNEIFLDIDQFVCTNNLYNIENITTRKLSDEEIKSHCPSIKDFKGSDLIFNAHKFGGNQSDVSNLLKAYLSNESLSVIDSQKAALLNDLLNEYFPNSSEIEKINLASHYAEGGCCYMAVANSFATYIESLENGRDIFRDKFGYVLAYEDGIDTSYNLEAIAFEIYLQYFSNQFNKNANLVLESDKGAGISAAEFESKVVTFFNNHGFNLDYNFELNVDYDSLRNYLLYRLLKNKNGFNILVSSKFDMEFLTSEANFSSNDVALKNSVSKGNIKKDIGGHAMLVTGVDEFNEILVSSWSKECKFLTDSVIKNKQAGDQNTFANIWQINFSIPEAIPLNDNLTNITQTQPTEATYNTNIDDSTDVGFNSAEKKSYNANQYKGRTSDVSTYIKNLLFGSKMSELETQKAHNLNNVITSHFTDVTDIQRINLANAFASKGNGWLSIANKFIAYMDSIENGESIFKERFGFDIKSTYGQETSYNAETLAFDIFLSYYSKHQTSVKSIVNYASDIDILNDNALNEQIKEYFKEKNIDFNFQVKEYDLQKEDLVTELARDIKASKGNCIIASNHFDMRESAPPTNLISHKITISDKALQFSTRSGNLYKNVGSHIMSVIGLDADLNPIVSSWGKEFTFDADSVKKSVRNNKYLRLLQIDFNVNPTKNMNFNDISASENNEASIAFNANVDSYVDAEVDIPNYQKADSNEFIETFDLGKTDPGLEALDSGRTEDMEPINETYIQRKNRELLTQIRTAQPVPTVKPLSELELLIKRNELNRLKLDYDVKNYLDGVVFELDVEMAEKIAQAEKLNEEISMEVGSISSQERQLIAKFQQNEHANRELKNSILEKASHFDDFFTKARALYIELNRNLNYDSTYFRSNKIIKEALVTQDIDFATLSSDHKVICKGWAQLYRELLLESGFDPNLVTIKQNGQHHWVEIKYGEEEILVADATDALDGRIDLAAVKSGMKTHGFIILPKSMSGVSLKTLYKQDYFKMNISNIHINRLLEADRQVGYSSSKGYLEEQLKASKKLFGGNRGLFSRIFKTTNTQETIEQFFNRAVPENIDGYEIYAYYKTIYANVLSQEEFDALKFNCLYKEMTAPSLSAINKSVDAIFDMSYTKDGQVIHYVYSKIFGKMILTTEEEYQTFLRKKVY